MAAVRHTAELLWTSQSTFRGADGHDKEFCSGSKTYLLNPYVLVGKTYF